MSRKAARGATSTTERSCKGNDFETRSTFSCEAATRSAREGTEPNERLSRENREPGIVYLLEALMILNPDRSLDQHRGELQAGGVLHIPMAWNYFSPAVRTENHDDVDHQLGKATRKSAY